MFWGLLSRGFDGRRWWGVFDEGLLFLVAAALGDPSL